MKLNRELPMTKATGFLLHGSQLTLRYCRKTEVKISTGIRGNTLRTAFEYCVETGGFQVLPKQAFLLGTTYLSRYSVGVD